MPIDAPPAIIQHCAGTIQKIKGTFWTIPNAGSPPCKAQIESRQIKGGLLKVCRVRQKCDFAGDIVKNVAGAAYWDLLDADPVHATLPEGLLLEGQ
jgi:hypothetical protein